MHLLYGKTRLRQIHAFWLVVSRSGFCSTDRFQRSKQAVHFCFWALSWQFQNFQPKRRNKMWILSFSIAKLPEKAKRIEILVRFQRWWMKKKNILRERSVLSWTSGNFWCRKWKRHRQKPGGQRRFYQPTEKCKHKREDCYWYEHFSPLHRN